MNHSLEFTRAMSQMTLTNVFFTALLYNMKIEARDDLPFVAGTDGVHLYYHPEMFATKLKPAERIFAIVHELLHVILLHNTRRGIRESEKWNIACDHVVNLLCLDYKFQVPAWACQDAKYKGMTAEQVYDALIKEDKEDKGDEAGKKNPMSGDVLDYDPAQNEGVAKSDIEREIAIRTEQAMQTAKAAGSDLAGMKRTIGDAQVSREPWYQHLRRWMTLMHSRQYNWSRINARRAVLHGVISPQQKSENMGKVVFALDCSGSITAKQLNAMGAHVSDILKDVNPSAVVLVYFDSAVCHVEEFTGPDYAIALSPHGGGGTDFAPIFQYVGEEHSDAQVVCVFTDLLGPFGEEPGVPVLWVSQTESVLVPFGELIYGDLNEN